MAEVLNVIWVGGTSALARTYVEEIGGRSKYQQFRTRFLMVGHEPPMAVAEDEGTSFGAEHSSPTGLVASHTHLDLTSRESVQTLFDRLPKYSGPTIMVVSVRPPLVEAPTWPRWLGGNDERNNTTTRRSAEGSQSMETTVTAGNLQLVASLEYLVQIAAKSGVLGVLHVSSIAAVDHLRPQHNLMFVADKHQVFVSEKDPLPPLEAYRGPYDVFKRQSEDVINRACAEHALTCTHLRIGAIFSNDQAVCIQCSALKLSSWPIACYLPTRIDCNSSRNVCLALQAIFERFYELKAYKPISSTVATSGSSAHAHANTEPPRSSKSNNGGNHKPCIDLAPVYYYTRASVQGGDGLPCAYGDYLLAYRSAFGYNSWRWPTLWLQGVASLALMAGLLQCLLCLSVWCPLLLGPLTPTLASIDYLLKVSQNEHTFDCRLFHRHFPKMSEREEDMPTAFRRIHLHTSSG